MIGWEKRVLLRHYLAQGLTKAVIAERLGINRRTINRWISKGDLDRDVDATVPRYGPRPAVPTKLDLFKPIIETRLKALPELSAVRLLEEIRAAGYTGGYTQLKEYVRKIRPRETEAVVRFETPPGHQAQVDHGGPGGARSGSESDADPEMGAGVRRRSKGGLSRSGPAEAGGRRDHPPAARGRAPENGAGHPKKAAAYFATESL